MIRSFAQAIPLLLPTLALAACKPPPTDEAGARGALVEKREAPSEPIVSPDTSEAIWAPSSIPGRIIYGNVGEAPLLALECLDDGEEPRLRVDRYTLADEGAGALLAFVGNSHILRMKVDATALGDVFVWEGNVPASEPSLEVLTGRREATATVPGGGKLTLNPSELPRDLIENCRMLGVEPTGDENGESEPSDAQPAP